TQKFKPVKILIDEGSMRSFIKTETAKRLGLPLFNDKIRTYYGIGGLKSTSETSETNLIFHNQDGSIVFTKMIAKPVLTEPLSCPRLGLEDKAFIEKHGLQLANPSVNGELFEPDIILGMDRYRLFMKMNNELELPSKLTYEGISFWIRHPRMYQRFFSRETYSIYNHRRRIR
ncbi:unnamed protein product, partial [Auanema sp. JU1783]